MRTKNSIKNISINIITQILMALLGFISRKVFLNNLGIQYLGVNGLLTNVLSLLGLLEAGIGTSIVYNLYKPLAENNEEKINVLMKLYKKAYTILAIIVFIFSLCLYPLMIKIMNGTQSVNNLTLVYTMFVIRNVLIYLYSYKWCVINADQKGYILIKRNMYFSIISTIAKIIILKSTQNYILYLLIDILIMIVQFSLNSKIVDKKYPYIKINTVTKLDKETKNNIKSNVKALFIQNLGNFCVFGTDNLLISKFVNIATVGIYSNYTMIIGQVIGVLYPVMGGIGNSVGNLLAVESEEKAYFIFKVTYFVNFWIYSFVVIFLFNLLNPFISWWIGKEYLLDSFAFVIILINCYLNGLRNSISTFKVKAGIFVEDKYVPLIEALINLTCSLILVKYLGLVGIFLGTTISTLTVAFWNVPRLVYKYVFKKPVTSYFKKYIVYFVVTILVGSITTYICNKFILGNDFLHLIMKGIICVIVPNTLYIIIFFKSEELNYLYSVFKEQIVKRYSFLTL